MGKGVLQAADEVFRRLGERSLAVRLARVAKHDAKHMRLATLAVRADDRRAGAEIHLSLLARGRFQPTKRRCRLDPQPAHKTLHTVVAGREVVVGGQILPNPLGREPSVELGQNQLAVRFAFATSAGAVVFELHALAAGEPVGGMAAFESAA